VAAEATARRRLAHNTSRHSATPPRPAYISRIESGQRRPSLKALRKLAPKLETTAHWLETGAPDPADELAALVLEYKPRPLPRRATQLARKALRESARASSS
jgi:transcriptional regulator with XRE-family HTH domain